jgi:hypothetical protein
MGKFGNRTNCYEIDLKGSDPFQPQTHYSYKTCGGIVGTTAAQSQLHFLKKFRALL